MAQVVIENPVINSPFEESARHFRFTDEGITNEIVEGRRISSFFVPIARPRKKGQVAKLSGNLPQNVNFALNAAVARAFLDANGVDYETAPSTRVLSAADVGDRAKRFTVVVECWK